MLRELYEETHLEQRDIVILDDKILGDNKQIFQYKFKPPVRNARFTKKTFKVYLAKIKDPEKHITLSEEHKDYAWLDRPTIFKYNNNIDNNFKHYQQELDSILSIFEKHLTVNHPEYPLSIPIDQPTFRSIYAVNNFLFEGGTSNVWSATRRSDNEAVVIKFVDKKPNTPDGRLPREVLIYHQLKGCEGLIPLLDHHELPKTHALVFEEWNTPKDRPPGAPTSTSYRITDLEHYITVMGLINENMTRIFFKQIVDIVINIYTMGMIHRDIQSENIVIDARSHEIRIIDFDKAAYIRDTYDETMGTTTSTPPEWFLHHEYTPQGITTWSLGIVLYEMIYGDVPFDMEDEIVYAPITFNPEISATPALRHLIRRCLTKDPEDRITLEGISEHPWLKITNRHNPAIHPTEIKREPLIRGFNRIL